ncbi:hypothetical protein [Sphingobium sp. RAC03]|uniref:hypothetical protein n=1 Tax=Sphingobium sp. RAC03 TaxID=1843368 RepID=UPI00149558B0|nr:hypothetical protein [Sphingobium sp. RAC03]
MSAPALTDRARSIARDIGRLHPDWQNPERYFERRDDLRRQLQQLARAIERAGH